MTLTLRDRIILTLVPLLIILVVLGSSGVVLLYRLGGRIDAILRENFDSIIAMKDLNEALERIDSSFQFTLADQELKARELYRKNWEIYRQNLGFEQGNITIAGEGDLVAQISDLTEQYQKRGDAFYARPARDPQRNDDYFGSSGLLATFTKIKSISSQISQLNQDNMEQASRKAKRTAAMSLTGFGIGLALALILAGLSAWHTLHSILTPINAMTKSAINITAGNLDQVVPYLSRDALGQLAQAFNRMASHLREGQQTAEERTKELLASNETLRREISERERMAQSIRQMAAIVESSDDAIVGYDWDGNITSWNQGAERIFGYSAERAVGQSQTILVPSDYGNELPAIRDMIRRGERVEHFETVRRTKDGRRIDVSLTVSPVRDETGVIFGVASIARDITQRKQAEEALRRASGYNRRLIESSLDPLVTIGPDGKITDVNAATEDATGYSREELVGRDFAEHFTEPEKARAGYQQVFSEGRVRDYPLEIRHRNGHVRSVLYNAAVYRDESGIVIGVFAAARDITERKRAEGEVRQLAHLQTVLAELGQWALRSRGAENVLDGAVMLVAQALNVDFCNVAELLPGGEELILRAGFGWKEGEVGRATFKSSDSQAGFTVRNKGPVIVDDAAKETRFVPLPRLLGETSVSSMSVVISTSKGPYGALGTHTKHRRKFTNDEVNFLQAAANVLGAVIERNRAEDQVERLARVQATVAGLGQRALANEPLDTLFDETVSLVAATLAVEYCKVLELLPNGQALLLRSGVGWSEGLVGQATVGSGSDSQAGYTLLSDRPVIVEDLRTEMRFSGPPLLHEHGVVSGMSVIISTSNGSYGVLGAHTKRRRSFTQDEVHFLQAVANVLGSAIQRHRAEEALRRVNRAHRALSSCNQALIRATDERALLQQICRIIVDEASYRFCWVGYAEQDETRLVRPVAHAGVEEGYLKTLHVTWADTERGHGPTGTCIRTGQTVVVKDTSIDPLFAPWRDDALKRGYSAAIAIPLFIETTPLGALNIYASEPAAFGDREVDLLTELANDLAYGVRALRTRAEHVAAAAALRERDEHVRLLLDSTAEAICGIDLAGSCIWVNQACARMLGYAGPDDFLGKNLHTLVHHSRPDGTPLSEEECQIHQLLKRNDNAHAEDQVFWREDGTCFPVEYWSHPVRRDGQVIGAVVTFLDITARKKAEAQIQHLAYFDALTDLPNRVLFQDRLKQALTHAKRQNRLAAVHFFDLDHFKDVNDSLGHAVGDKLLKAIAERLQNSLRASDTVARLGGDEFAILQTDLARVEAAANLAEKVLKIISEPFLIDGHQIRTTVSIGITVYPIDDGMGTQLLQNADMAMYLAKKEGRNNFQFYTASLNTDLQEHMALLADLHQALERREFVLHYQPQFDLRHQGLVGMEALIRWQHPLRGLVSPAKFIPLAEEAGLIVPLGRWVLEQGCAQNQAWQSAGLPARRVAINVSAMQLKHDDLVTAVSEALEKTGLAPQWLELELTETTLLQDLQAAAPAIQQLHQRGIQVAIDDFGTGYSSLNYLSRLPFDKLKIDQSFVRNLRDDPDAAAVAKAIIDLGHCLGMKVIAEGVETREQLDYLLAKGCDEAQGYYFDRPMPAAELASLLQKEKES